MSLIGFEGFDHLGRPNITAGPYLLEKPFLTGLGGSTGGAWSGGDPALENGLLGGLAGQYTNGTLSTCTLGSTYARGIFGDRFRTRAGGGAHNILYVSDGGTIQSGLSINSSNQLYVWQGSTSTVLATGTTVLSQNSWYMIEWDITINNTTGAFEVRINGSTEISASGQNTRTTANNYFGNFTITGPGSGNSVAHDDLTMVDTVGSAPYNTFLGIVRVETLFPTSANATTWTPLSGTNVSQIQEVNADGDSTYNSTTTSGNQDTFNHGSLSSTPNTIFAVAVTSGMRKDDVGSQQGQTVLISGVTTQTGTAQTMQTSYFFLRDVYLNDPNTSAAWTGANVNATKIGYKHV